MKTKGIILIGLLSLPLIACGNNSNGGTLELSEQRRTFEDKVTSIDFDILVREVTFSYDEQATSTSLHYYDGEQDKINFSFANGALIVKEVSTVKNLNIKTEQVGFEVVLPGKSINRIHGDIDVGSFTISGIDVADFEIDSGVGAISASNCALGVATISSDVGDIKCNAITGTGIDLEVNVGNISFLGADASFFQTASIDLEASIGSISYFGEDKGKSYRVERSSASVFVAEVDTGSITIA